MYYVHAQNTNILYVSGPAIFAPEVQFVLAVCVVLMLTCGMEVVNSCFNFCFSLNDVGHHFTTHSHNYGSE